VPTRRTLLKSLTAGAVAPLFGQAPAFVRSERPATPYGVMSGDVIPGAAMVWSRSDRPARMRVSWKTSERGEVRHVVGPHCLDVTDYTGRVELSELPSGQTILYEVQFEDLTNSRARSEVIAGRFRTPPAGRQNVSFLWTGDLVGQGWGINPEWGGIRMFDTMLRTDPDLFIHSGDVIYADNPLQEQVKLSDGSMWRNVVAEGKHKVAETLEEFRGNYRYNLRDEHCRKFVSSVAQVWQWDDHEVMNNWSSSKDLRDDARYQEKNVPLLVARATRAFQEYAPLRPSAQETERVYRKISYGPLLDIFVLDMRSYRGPNTHNRQTEESEDTRFLGAEQMAWLQRDLRASRAVWKAMAADMPIGLLVGDGKDAEGRPRFEAYANGDGPPLGRELELARLLRFIQLNRIQNVVWFTADVHYTAAHYYDPRKARFTEFSPFWEFVSGPMHAGTFGPGQTDDTFGVEVKYAKAPPKGQSNLPPSAGMQFFGEVRIEGRTRAMTVTLRDLAGAALFTQVLEAAPTARL
jgi:alkaline phosphatase D